MERDALRRLLESVASGGIDVSEATEQLSLAPVQELGFASIDHHRELRAELPEVVYGPGKTPAQVAAIAREIFDRSARVLVTRTSPAQLDALREAIPVLQPN